jgi:carbamoyltransferase
VQILGISAYYHESAACLLQQGSLVAAAAEERFSRQKHDARLPVEAVRFCLRQGKTCLAEIAAIAYYELPQAKLARQLWSGALAASDPQAPLDPRRPERALRERLGFEGPIYTYPHHLSHAASAFHYSPFSEAAVLTADGVGEWTTTAYGHGRQGGVEIFEEVSFPHSLGLLYSTITAYLGFRVNDGEYKVMGLAPYGEPRYIDEMCQLIGMGEDGQFLLNLRYFDFLGGDRMDSDELAQLLGAPRRHPQEEITAFHHDVARSLQLLVEEILLEKARYLHARVDTPNLCLAGGVALNCVANGRIAREGPFEHLFVQPAAGDSGACLGAAALAHHELTGARVEPLRDVLLGPSYSSDGIARLLAATSLDIDDFRAREDDLLEEVARRLAEGQLVGWFHGRMEHGPRALGARSILANPTDPMARDRLNRVIKGREDFRPFAPSVLAESAGRHFDLMGPSPYMLLACNVISPLELPAITHVDGSARPQTVDEKVHPRFARLLRAFERLTQCPLLLNTSFNGPGEPIVCSPVDALSCFARTGLDTLVLEDFIIDGAAVPTLWQELLPVWETSAKRSTAPKDVDHPLRERLYTFV